MKKFKRGDIIHTSFTGHTFIVLLYDWEEEERPFRFLYRCTIEGERMGEGIVVGEICVGFPRTDREATPEERHILIQHLSKSERYSKLLSEVYSRCLENILKE